ncbi:MAG: ABC transporter permease [Eubacterium sp.]|nr:ABC transporter permease [Eubacterium sp.]
MNIVKKLTLRHIKKNMSRTVVTILGICVSVAMITAVLVAVASYMNFNKEVKIFYNGNWHFILSGIDSEELSKLKENELVESVGIKAVTCMLEEHYFGSQYIGRDFNSFHITEGDIPVASSIYYGDEEYFKQIITCAYDGEFPKNKNEIAVEAEFIESNGLDWKIGDTVTLAIGIRYQYKDEVVDSDFGPYSGRKHGGSSGGDDKWYYTGNYYDPDDRFLEKENRQYKIVGILHNNRPTVDGAAVLCCFDEALIEENGDWPASVKNLSEEEKEINRMNALKELEIFKGKSDEEILDAIYNDEFLEALRKGEIKSDYLRHDLLNYSGLSVAVTLAHPNYRSRYEIDEIIRCATNDEEEFEKFSAQFYNDDLLDACFAFGGESEFVNNVFVLVLGILVIIAIASVVLIYNAFGMSLSEKTRYLGMLGSVGATKKQKKQSVYFEGMILGAIGIPLGLLLGILGITALMQTMGAAIQNAGILIDPGDSAISMKTVVPSWVIFGVVIIGIITVFVSSVLPAKKASAVTPIEALRQSEEIKVKPKNLKTPKLIRLIFGYEGELAHKNLKRNGKKAYVIIASIALSVALFLSVNYFCTIFAQVNNLDSAIYQVTLQVKHTDKAEAENILGDIEGIDDIVSADCISYSFGKYTERTGIILVNDEVVTPAYSRLWNEPISAFVNIINDDDFNALCEANGIDYNEYYNNGFKAVLMNNINHRKNGSKVFNENAIGKVFAKYAGDDSPVKIGGLVDFDKKNYACLLNPVGSISAFMPESVFYSVPANEEKTATLGIVTKENKAVCEKLTEIGLQSDFEVFVIKDIIEEHEEQNTMIYVLKVFTYGFIALITLITLANIVNTISTSIASRRREFAMYKSVGTTQRGFYKMICLESLFYGLNALLFSLPASILASFIMNITVGDGKIPFELDYEIYIAVILAVFLIIGFSMLYSVSRLKDDSIAETLSEDIS